MKKKIFTTILLSSILLPGAITTYAADASSAESDVNITLKKDTGSNTTENGEFQGKLAIVHYPSAYKFVGNASEGSITMQNTNPNKDKQYISVNDDRSDDQDPGKWVLTGQLSEIKRLDENGFVATDATIAPTTLAGALQITSSTIHDYNIGTNPTPNGQDIVPEAIVEGTPEAAADYKFAQPVVSLIANAAAQPVIQANSANNENPGVYANLGNASFIVDAGYGTNGSLTGDVNYHGTVTWSVGAEYTPAP